MSMYATLEEAIDTAREEFIEASRDNGNDDQGPGG